MSPKIHPLHLVIAFRTAVSSHTCSFLRRYSKQYLRCIPSSAISCVPVPNMPPTHAPLTSNLRTSATLRPSHQNKKGEAPQQSKKEESKKNKRARYAAENQKTLLERQQVCVRGPVDAVGKSLSIASASCRCFAARVCSSNHGAISLQPQQARLIALPLCFRCAR